MSGPLFIGGDRRLPAPSSWRRSDQLSTVERPMQRPAARPTANRTSCSAGREYVLPRSVGAARRRTRPARRVVHPGRPGGLTAGTVPTTPSPKRSERSCAPNSSWSRTSDFYRSHRTPPKASTASSTPPTVRSGGHLRSGFRAARGQIFVALDNRAPSVTGARQQQTSAARGSGHRVWPA